MVYIFRSLFILARVCSNISDFNNIKVKKAKIRNQYNQTPHLTRNTISESDKKHLAQENQEVSPFPSRGSQGCKEQTRPYNKDKPETYKTKRIHKRSVTWEWSVIKSLVGLSMFNGTNLTLSSDVDQGAYGKVTKTQHTRKSRG